METTAQEQRKRRLIAVYIPIIIMCLLGRIACIGMGAGGEPIEFAIDEDIDRLVVMRHTYDRNENQCIMITDPILIYLWKQSHVWTNSMEICCDERTTHVVYAFDGSGEERKMSYSAYFSGYNNPAFEYMQSIAVAEYELTFWRSWYYSVSAPASIDFDEFKRQMNRIGWFVTEPYRMSYGKEIYFEIITPYRLFAPARAIIQEEYQVSFYVDEYGY